LPAAAAQKDFQAYLAKLGRQNAARPSNPASDPAPTATPGAAQTPEHHLLFLWLHFEALHRPLANALQHDWVDAGQLAGVLLNRFLGEFEQGQWPGRDQLEPLLETPEERALIATLLFESPVIDDPLRVAGEGVRQLRSRAVEPRLRQIELALANHRADSESDPISLLKERSELHRLLRQPIVLSPSV
jgi:DNA primase